DVGRIRPGDQQRGRVPAVHDLQLPRGGVEHRQAQGGDDARVVAGQDLVDQAGDGQRRVPLQDEGTQRVPELTHHRGRVQRVALHVADGDQDPVLPAERLVEVAADLGLVAGREVAERDGQAGYLRRGRRQQATLQGQRDDVLLGV